MSSRLRRHYFFYKGVNCKVDKEDIDKEYEKLNEEQKTNYLNQFDKSKKNLITGIY